MEQQIDMEVNKNDLSITENENIKNLIYTIRGKQVMLDSDVAMLYHYPTKRINEAVNRNKQRFPDNFCFQLTEEEYTEIKDYVENLGIQNGYMQELEENEKKYVPNWNI